MAWAEAHMAVGAGVYALTHLANGGEPAVYQVGCAVALACMTHWPLDDLNVGDQMIYHGIGEKLWSKVVSGLMRIPVWGALIYLFYQYPESMICALPAWLVLDHEWILNLFGKHGYGLHRRRWFSWLRSEWGLVVWLAAFALMFLMIV